MSGILLAQPEILNKTGILEENELRVKRDAKQLKIVYFQVGTYLFFSTMETLRFFGDVFASKLL